MNKQKLMLVINTLNKIPVSGKDNLDMLLGCILALEEMAQEQEGEVKDNG